MAACTPTHTLPGQRSAHLAGSLRFAAMTAERLDPSSPPAIKHNWGSESAHPLTAGGVWRCAGVIEYTHGLKTGLAAAIQQHDLTGMHKQKFVKDTRRTARWLYNTSNRHQLGALSIDSSRYRIWLTYALQVKIWPEQSVQRLSVCYDGSLLLCDFREVNLKVFCGTDPFSLLRRHVLFCSSTCQQICLHGHVKICLSPEAETKSCQIQPREIIFVWDWTACCD